MLHVITFPRYHAYTGAIEDERKDSFPIKEVPFFQETTQSVAFLTQRFAGNTNVAHQQRKLNS